MVKLAAILALLFLAPGAMAQGEPLFTDPEGDVEPALGGAPDPGNAYPPNDGLDIVAVAVGPDQPQYIPFFVQIKDQGAMEGWQPPVPQFSPASARFDFSFEPSWTDASLSARTIWDGEWDYFASASGPGFSFGLRVDGASDLGDGWIRIDVPRHLFQDPLIGDRLSGLNVEARGLSDASIAYNCGSTVSCDFANGAGKAYTFTNHTSGGLVFDAPNLTVINDGPAAVDVDATNVGVSWRFAFHEHTRTFNIQPMAPEGWTIDAPASVTLDDGATKTIPLAVTAPENATPGTYPITIRFTDERRVDDLVLNVGLPARDGSVPDSMPEPDAPKATAAPLGVVPLLLFAALRRFDN